MSRWARLFVSSLVLVVVGAICVGGVGAYYLRIGLFDGSAGELSDITDLCREVFGFWPTNLLPVNVQGDCLVDGYIAFNKMSGQLCYYDASLAEAVPIADWVSGLLGFEPLRISVVHRQGEYDELLLWASDRIVMLDLDGLELSDVTTEFEGAIAVSGLCLSDASNLDQETIVFDGEEWYLDFEPVGDLIGSLLGVPIVRLTPFDFAGGAADDGVIFTYQAENQPPFADFSISPEGGDTRTTFWFDASSCWDREDSAEMLRVQWDWETDGVYDTELSTEKLVAHKFATSGLKEITLLVADTNGATSTRTRSLYVSNSPPSADFVFSPKTGTVGTLFWFDASGSSDAEDASEELQVRWDFESDGEFDTEFSTQKTVWHRFARPRLYDVTVQVKDTASSTARATKSVLVENMRPFACFTVSPTAGTVVTEFSFDASCCVDAEDGTDALQVRWDWDGDGVYDTPFGFEKVAYQSFWEVGQRTIGLEVMDSTGATASTLRRVLVRNTPPHAAFLVQPQEGTVRTAFSFNAAVSYDLEDELADLKVRWDFDSDGQYDTDYSYRKSASFRFTNPGPKTVTLQVVDTAGASDTASKTVNVVNTAPTACFVFTPTKGDTNTEFGFDASCSSDWESTVGALQFRWDWEDDGVFDTDFLDQAEAHHRYDEPGTKTVLLVVRDADGATAQTTRSIVVQQGNRPPTACFVITPQSGTTETVFEFDASCSSDPDPGDGPSLEVRWDFDGDGVFDTEFSRIRVAYHSYSVPGYKTVVLEVKDPDSFSDQCSQRILVEEANEPPIACFAVSPESGDTSTEFSFDASCSTDPDGSDSTLQFRWDWTNDGVFDTSFTTSKTSTHRFTAPGEKTELLQVKDEQGGVDTTTRTVTVEEANEPPVACFAVWPVSGDTTTDFEFDASCSSDPDGSDSTLQVRWDWTNDGVFDTAFATGKVATHRYTTPGTKTARLQVRDEKGATDETTWTIEVQQGNAPPAACFDVAPQTGTTETDFEFDASCSSDPDGSDSTLQVRWDWTNDSVFDTSFTTSKTTTHRFAEPGTITVLLEVKDEGGATGRTARQIVVEASGNNPPVAYFTVTPSTGTTATVFLFDASGSYDEDEATGGTLQVQWDFDGDGTFDTSYTTEKTITHSFGEAGVYDVTVRVKDPQGATDTYTRRVYVY